MDWAAAERVAALVGAGGQVLDGRRLAELRRELLEHVQEAASEVASETGMQVRPPADLLVVDRRAWVHGNLETFNLMLPDLPIPAAAGRVLAVEGGAVLGIVSRMVLAQYDPFRDLLIVVYPNLHLIGGGNALRWLIFHEVTHLAQFRTAPWMTSHIRDRAREALDTGEQQWIRDAVKRVASVLPELAPWLRRVLAGQNTGQSPLLAVLPERQRRIIAELNSLLTVLEGHATYVCDRISKRLLSDHEELNARINQVRQRPAWQRVIEALMGLEMKRRQYVQGREFCAHVWETGGAGALAPVWDGPALVPTAHELARPQEWLRRVA